MKNEYRRDTHEFPVDVLFDLLIDVHAKYHQHNPNSDPAPAKGESGNRIYHDKLVEDIAKHYGNNQFEDRQVMGEALRGLKKDISKVIFAYSHNESHQTITREARYPLIMYGYARGKWQGDLDKCLKGDVNEIFTYYKNKRKKTEIAEKPDKRFLANLWYELREKVNVEDKPFDFVDFLDGGFKRDPSTIKKFYISDPASIIEKIKNEKVPFAIRNKTHAGKTVNVFEESDGILLCHALSIHSDNLFLLCELGRFVRIANIFNTQKRKIFLTDRDFGELNRTVSDFKEKDQYQTKNNLQACLKFRESLYKKLGFSYTQTDQNIRKCSTYNVDNSAIKKYFPNLQWSDIETKVNDCVDLSKGILELKSGELYTVGTIKNKKMRKKIEKIFDDYKSGRLAQNKTEKLIHHRLVRRRIDSDIELIKMVLDKLHAIDKITFQYFFLQYYHQFPYNNYLKISVDREKPFDETFETYMYLHDDIEGYKLYGLYFDNYKCFYEDEMVTVFPYYFPSGLLYEKASNVIEAENHVILMKDANDAEKIKKVVQNYLQSPDGKMELARIMADLLSFVDHFFYKKSNSTSSEFKQKIQKIIESSSDRLIQNNFNNSWKFYADCTLEQFQKKISLFQQNFITLFEDLSEIPYWFYPFILNEEVSDDDLVNFYTKIINTVLTFVQRETEYEDWFIPDY